MARLPIWILLFALWVSVSDSQAIGQSGEPTQLGKEDPGWFLQTTRRSLLVANPQGLDPDSEVGLMFQAYDSGMPLWRDTKGNIRLFEHSGVNLLSVVFRDQVAVPAWRPPAGAEVLGKAVIAEQQVPAVGTQIFFGPLNVTEDLKCCIDFTVINDTPEHARAAGIDHLAATVGLFGVEDGKITTSDRIRPGTQVDLWSSKKLRRYTITRWGRERTGGHSTVQTYGPLLFNVLDSEPDFLFIDGEKISLSAEFQAGCRDLCDRIMKLRREQGQPERPKCQGLSPQPAAVP